MNNARLAALQQGLSSVAKKVLDATPIEEAWSVTQIMQEMHRAIGTHHERRVVAGALASMVQQGIVRELLPGRFQRVTAKAVIDKPVLVAVRASKTAQPGEQAKVSQPSTEASGRGSGPVVDQIAQIAAQLRNASKQFSLLAEDLDAIAIEAQDRMEVAEKSLAKMREFKALLGSLGGGN